mmetsp:Transcript_30381/g.60479  ORF Transcript_30381/g.60479 Transcript_30381/m.60479 type:complete len:301 (+) Transcript_30381:59-961(+)
MAEQSADPNAPIYENTNGVPLCNGKNLHMEVGFGDIANRVITVGSEHRAEKIATFLDASPAPKKISSGRGFTTITGYFNGVNVSIVAIGMGPSMMDFFVRETRAVVKGPMAMIRFGTCGGLTLDTPAGCVMVATGGSGYISRNPDAFSGCYNSSFGSHSADAELAPYHMSKIAPADAELSAMVVAKLGEKIGADNLRTGANVTAESFYSSQGRIDPDFDDRNHDINALLLEHYPTARSLEMESFWLLHLAKCCKVPIKAAAAAIVLANRPTGHVMDGKLLDDMERNGGLAMLQAISQVSL